MNLKECYEKIGADYESVFARLGSENMIYRFLNRYFEKNEYEELENAVRKKRWKDAFMYSHNMKGYGLNLSLTELADASSELCEALRDGEPKGDIELMLSKVKTAYDRTEEAVRSLDVI